MGSLEGVTECTVQPLDHHTHKQHELISHPQKLCTENYAFSVMRQPRPPAEVAYLQVTDADRNCEIGFIMGKAKRHHVLKKLSSI